MKLPVFGQLPFEKMMPWIIGAVFLVAVVIVLNNIIKNIFFQSAYVETLREFAAEHGCKKPISKWLFILIEVVGVFLALFFISSFLKNALAATGILAVFLVLSVFVAIKYHTPPLKAFALAEGLTYVEDVVSGNYKGRDLVVKMEKKSVYLPQESMADRNNRVDIVRRRLFVSFLLDHESMAGMTYEKGKIAVTPDTLKADLNHVGKMLSKMPPADKARFHISSLNGKKFLTLEKINSGFLFVAELYYLCEAAGRAADILNGGLARFSPKGEIELFCSPSQRFRAETVMNHFSVDTGIAETGEQK